MGEWHLIFNWSKIVVAYVHRLGRTISCGIGYYLELCSVSAENGKAAQKDNCGFVSENMGRTIKRAHAVVSEVWELRPMRKEDRDKQPFCM